MVLRSVNCARQMRYLRGLVTMHSVQDNLNYYMASPVSTSHWLRCLSCWWSLSTCRGNANLSGLAHSQGEGMFQFGIRTSHSHHSAPLCSIVYFAESAHTWCALWGRQDGDKQKEYRCIQYFCLSLKNLAYAHIKVKQYRMICTATGRRLIRWCLAREIQNKILSDIYLLWPYPRISNGETI